MCKRITGNLHKTDLKAKYTSSIDRAMVKFTQIMQLNTQLENMSQAVLSNATVNPTTPSAAAEIVS